MDAFVLEEVGALINANFSSEVVGVYATLEEAQQASHTSMPFVFDSDFVSWHTPVNEDNGIGFKITVHVVVLK